MKSIIIYTTKYGSVAKAAQMLKAKLGGDVAVADAGREAVPDLSGYDRVMLGGSIYVGKVQKKLTAYINAHLPELLEKRVGLFLCAGQDDPVQQVAQMEQNFPAPLYQKATAKGFFGDEVYIEKVNWFERLALKKIKGVTRSYSRLSDEAIERFAREMEGTK